MDCLDGVIDSLQDDEQICLRYRVRGMRTQKFRRICSIFNLIWRWRTEGLSKHADTHTYTQKNTELWETLTCNKKKKNKELPMKTTKESDQEDR